MEITSSIIICTKNRLADLLTCLLTVAAQTAFLDELIIVDSSDIPINQDQSFNTLFSKKNFPHTKLCYLHTQPGLTYQRNRGIQKAQGDIIYFFDDDVELDQSYVQKMNQVFIQHPEYAGGMGTIKNVDAFPSWKYRLFRTFFMLPRLYASGNITWSGMPTHPYGTTQFKSVEVLGGCGMAFRNAALQQHKFDEHLHGYCYMEDADIACRISYEAPLFFNPEAQLIHHESPIARDQLVDRSAMLVYNYSYLFFKNCYARNRLKLIGYYWSLMGLFLEAVLMHDWHKFRGYWKGLCRWYNKKET